MRTMVLGDLLHLVRTPSHEALNENIYWWNRWAPATLGGWLDFWIPSQDWPFYLEKLREEFGL
jgi:hypothetical protein